MKDRLTITLITIDNDFNTIFSEKITALSPRGGMNITDQLLTLSCRLRTSPVDYRSDWHLAGDPTLIMIQQSTLRVILHDGSFKDFSAGEFFIAQDKLPEGIIFDPHQHGHRAEVVGEQDLHAVHVKLASPF
ncbi:MAG: hypothetical protein ACJAUP_001552 [Cellvibrionaceae bacterium]|jgi:hypothetical protein